MIIKDEELIKKINSDKEKLEKLTKLSKPLIEYIKKYFDFHTSIIISDDYIRVVRDEIGIPIEIDD